MITVINGTNRLDNNSLIVSKTMLSIFEKLDVKTNFVNLQDVYKHDFIKEVYGDNPLPFAEYLSEHIYASDKLVFVIPEYNGSFPGVLKTFIDYSIPKKYIGKKCGLIGVSSGRAGNLRGLEHFMGVLHYLRAEVMAYKPKVSEINLAIDENKQLSREDYLINLNNFGEMLLKF
jgi:chromate reductase, NAD(P)H dehydrogenase (quinone)